MQIALEHKLLVPGGFYLLPYRGPDFFCRVINEAELQKGIFEEAKMWIWLWENWILSSYAKNLQEHRIIVMCIA